MSIIDSGHLGGSDGWEEGSEEADLVRRREGVDLHVVAGGGLSLQEVDSSSLGVIR